MANSTRVASTSVVAYRALVHDGRVVADAATQLLSLIRTRISRQHAELFARPVPQADGTTIDWYVAGSGNVVALNSLDADEASGHIAYIEGQLLAVRELQETLADGPAQARLLGQLLHLLARPVAPNQIYLVGGRPVVILWGYERDDTVGVPSAPHVPSTSLRAATPVADKAANVPLPMHTTPAGTLPGQDIAAGVQPAWLRWLLLLLMALLLVYLIALLLIPLPPTMVQETLASPSLASEIAALEHDKAALIDKVLSLDEQHQQLMEQCTLAEPELPEEVDPPTTAPPATPPPQVVTKVEPPPVVVPEPEAPLVPEPSPFSDILAEIDEVQKPVESPPPVVTGSPPATVSKAPDKPPCATRKTYEAPEVMLVVDASGSMRHGIRGASNRMEASKSSIAKMVQRLPHDVDVGLIEFSDCSNVVAEKFYPHAERSTLLGRVNRLQPMQGTPLARAIERAGMRMSGKVPGIIVVVTDGADSCDGDACAVARAIASSQSNVSINVIDISGSANNPTARCIAAPSGGRVFQPNTSAEMAAMIKSATGEPDASACN